MALTVFVEFGVEVEVEGVENNEISRSRTS
jgi:hypothetical protein